MGVLLQYVDMVSVVCDLDLICVVLGDCKLNYFGYFYGIFFGVIYVEFYLKKIGWFVFDGVFDLVIIDFEVIDVQVKGFESVFWVYLMSCIGIKGCLFSGLVDDVMVEMCKILDWFQVSLLQNFDGCEFGFVMMFVVIILLLYNKDNWLYLNILFMDVLQGQIKIVFLLVDIYNDCVVNGIYNLNFIEVFVLINCLDYSVDSLFVQMCIEVVQFIVDVFIFGLQMVYGGMSCVQWLFLLIWVCGLIIVEGFVDIFVVGIINDFVIFYVWVQNFLKEFENGYFIIYCGEGYMVYNKLNFCVNDVVDNYFVKGIVLLKDLKC